MHPEMAFPAHPKDIEPMFSLVAFMVMGVWFAALAAEFVFLRIGK